MLIRSGMCKPIINTVRDLGNGLSRPTYLSSVDCCPAPPPYLNSELHLTIRQNEGIAMVKLYNLNTISDKHRIIVIIMRARALV